MAYKDEYEVARLYTDTFIRRAREGKFRRRLCASSSISRRRCLRASDKHTGEPKKMSFGPWMLSAFRLLAKFKFLRGTPLDIFGYIERAQDRARPDRGIMSACSARSSAGLTPQNHATAVALASLPEKIRGYGHVKQRHLTATKAEEAALYEHFNAGAAPFLKAAE